VIIVHPNKAGANDPLMRTNGARAFSQAVRSIIVLGRDPNDPENTSHRFPPHAKAAWARSMKPSSTDSNRR